MPVPYPTISTNQSLDLYSIFGFSNQASGGLFMPIMLLVVWVIAFVGVLSEGRQVSRAWIFSSFICSILAILLSLIGFLASQWMYFCFILTGIGLIWYFLSNAVGM